jgi:hypothetical protein
MALYAKRGERVVAVIAATGRSADDSGHGRSQGSYTRSALKKLGVVEGSVPQLSRPAPRHRHAH